MQNLMFENYAICLVRRSRSNDFVLPYITNTIVDKCILSTLDNANIFPLYLYNESKGKQGTDCVYDRRPNLNPQIVMRIADELGLVFTEEKEPSKDTFSPIDILDYIYAVLHSPSYRSKYINFLRIDFPKVPYPHKRKSSSNW